MRPVLFLSLLILAVGQRGSAGDVIAQLDRTTLELQVASAEAAVGQARSSANNARETLERQKTLKQTGTITRVAVDQAQARADTAAAQMVPAQKALETAIENLAKTELAAPFDGIISTVEAASIATIGPGTPIATMSPADSFEVSFSVGFDTVDQLVVGSPARVRLADRPEIALNAVVAEIGARANAVASFPVVLTLLESTPLLEAGMAVEAAIDLPGAPQNGFPIPLSALIRDRHATSIEGAQTMSVFVYDPGNSTVTRRDIAVGGIRENALVVLEAGERVASAGVSSLKKGRQVRLIDTGE